MQHHARAFVCLLLCALAQNVFAQAVTTFDPFPGGLAPQYRFNLDRAFFPGDSLGNASRAAFVADVNRFRAARDSITTAMRSSPEGLARALSAADSLRMRAARHFAYHNLRNIIDDRVPRPTAEAQDVANALGGVGFVNGVLIALPDSALRGWYARSPALSRWRFSIDQLRANAARDPAQVAAANSAAARLTGWQSAAFLDLIRRSIRYPPIQTPDGPKDWWTDGPFLMNHPQRSVRERWYRTNKTVLVEHRDTLATILTSIVNGRNEVARMRGFADYRAESYGGRFLTPSSVRTLLERIASASDVNKRYERMRNDRLRSQYGFADVHTWDLVLPDREMPVPRYTITDASQIIAGATSAFDANYRREMAALLDPSNGRLDLIPRPNRPEQQGFSSGEVGYPSVFFQGRYAGYIDDVIVFGHEAGHAVQNMLMDAAHVPLAYASGPGYFTESFATLNELLITDYLYRTAKDKPGQIYHLQRFLDQATQMFKGARESLVEDEYYAVVTPAKPGTGRTFEDISQRIGARYSIWFGPKSERPMEWVNALHYFTRPLYRINYTYATVLALNYFEQLTANREVFVPKFMALLSNGYDATPNDILKAFLGYSLDDPALVARAVGVISARLDTLSRLYR